MIRKTKKLWSMQIINRNKALYISFSESLNIPSKFDSKWPQICYLTQTHIFSVNNSYVLLIILSKSWNLLVNRKFLKFSYNIVLICSFKCSDLYELNWKLLIVWRVYPSTKGLFPEMVGYKTLRRFLARSYNQLL